ncbi:MAG: hypothetical protein KC729_06690 [Candidatus Eisenbacteria bacterium]|uniref:Uncharacterized protein n=1 Tax=Eiseniibacteriota bacterium TaxID=2212470 RepID=A0A956LYJ2_UNCEI|nr:hypothetical protein [Candidatus Eisenbacteria bacterium]
MTNVRAWGSGVSVLPDTIDIRLLPRSERSWAVPDQPLFVVGDSAYVFLDSVVAAPHPTLRYGRYSKWDIVGDSLYLRGVDVVCGDAMISTGRSALDLESRLNAR